MLLHARRERRAVVVEPRFAQHLLENTAVADVLVASQLRSTRHSNASTAAAYSSPSKPAESTSVPSMSNMTRCIYAARTHFTSVLKSGGLPNISRPMRNTFAANHTAPNTPAHRSPIDSHTCHAGGGRVDASRSNMANVFRGGRKLTTTASIESGLREIGNHKNHGTSAQHHRHHQRCASRMSLTAAPAAIMSEPMVKNAIKKNMNK